MGEHSDGETLQRQFSNIKAETAPNQAANTYAFMKFCHNMKNGTPRENCISELKAMANDDSFKEWLAIPKKTVIEPNIVNDFLSLLFAYKNQSHSVKFKLTNTIIDGFSAKYVEEYLKTNAPTQQFQPNKVKNDTEISINDENPTTDQQHHAQNENDSSKVTRLEIQIGKLTEKVNDLIHALNEERERNKQLTQKLLDYEMKENAKPHERKRKKPKKSASNATTGPTSGKNEMSCDETVDADDEITDFPKMNFNQIANASRSENIGVTTQNNTQNAAAVNGNDDEPNAHTAKMPNTAKRDKNIPPIVVHDSDQKRMNERIISRKICSRNEFHFTRVNKSKYRIHVGSLEQYDAVIAVLNEFGIKFHTYTPPERKTIHVLLKHVPTCYDEADIMTCLKDDYQLIPIKLTKFVTKQMLEKNIKSTMWHASFDPKTDKSRIYQIKHIGNQFGIVVEDMKNKSLTQCRRCWRYEHTQSNCSYDERCNKCLTVPYHGSGQCALDLNASLKPSCVNCRSESHAATSKECPVYQRILERKNTPGNKQTPTQTKPSASANKQYSSTAPNVSFAKVLQNNKPTRPKQSDKTIDPALIDIFKQLAIQQTQMNNLLMQIAPQLANIKMQ